MSTSEAKGLQRLREENACHKRLLGQAELEKGNVEGIIGRKLLSPARHHDAVWRLVERGYSRRYARQIVRLSRSAYRRAKARRVDTSLRKSFEQTLDQSGNSCIGRHSPSLAGMKRAGRSSSCSIDEVTLLCGSSALLWVDKSH